MLKGLEMKTLLTLVGVVVIVGCVWYCNSSPSDRANVKSRIERSIDGNSGGDREGVGGALPDIVRRQQECVACQTPVWPVWISWHLI